MKNSTKKDYAEMLSRSPEIKASFRKKRRWPAVLSVSAIIVSLISGYLAINAAYVSWQLKNVIASEGKAVQARLDTLMPVESSSLAPAAQNPAAAKSSETVVPMTEAQYNQQMSKNFQRASGTAASTSPSKIQAPDTGTQKATGTFQEINVNFDLGALFSASPQISLADQSGGNAAGEAWMAVYQGNTFLRLGAINLPAPAGDTHYEAWIAKAPAGTAFIDAGPLTFDTASGGAILTMATEGDQSEYRTVYISRETGQNAVKPANIIMSGTFAATQDPHVSSGKIAPAQPSSVSMPTVTDKAPIGDSTQAQSSLSEQDQLLMSLLGGQTAGKNGGNTSQSLGDSALLQALLGGKSTTGTGGADLQALLKSLGPTAK